VHPYIKRKGLIGNCRIFSHYEATEIAPMPIAFGEGMEFETDQTSFVAKYVLQIIVNSKGVEPIY
jgi:hypothetical protein